MLRLSWKMNVYCETQRCFNVDRCQGLDVAEGRLQLISNVISSFLGGIPCAVLMGANIAPEVAVENFCEATIG